MFNLEYIIDLPLIWSGIIGTAIFLYVLLDGFDLGIGILFPFAPTNNCRSTMMNSVAPFWDGNETWLVLGGGGLFAAFPLAYSIIMPALYIPIILMLIALIFRGVAFEFRFKAIPEKRVIWDYSFHFGSLFATFAQGMALGGFIQGITVEDQIFAGKPFDWLTVFSVMTGLALIFGYSLIGSTWLILKTTGETQEWARKTALYALIYVIIFMGIVSIWTPFIDEEIFPRWFSMPNIIILSPVPLLVILCTIYLVRSIKQGSEILPFMLSVALFTLGFIGLAISFWPWIVPYNLSIWDTAATGTSLSIMLVGVVIILPVILLYTGYSYYVFRGKATHERIY